MYLWARTADLELYLFPQIMNNDYFLGGCVHILVLLDQSHKRKTAQWTPRLFLSYYQNLAKAVAIWSY